MKIEMFECNSIGCSLLSDLAENSRVDAYIKKIRMHEAHFNPRDMRVKFDGQWYVMIDGGDFSPDFDKILRKLSRLPAVIRSIPNDIMMIKADIFESELYIDLDGEWRMKV